jgi:hypothetical protein
MREINAPEGLHGFMAIVCDRFDFCHYFCLFEFLLAIRHIAAETERLRKCGRKKAGEGEIARLQL